MVNLDIPKNGIVEGNVQKVVEGTKACLWQAA
jgi:hypothetical protein